MIFNVGPSGLSPYPDFTFTVGSTNYTFDSTSQTSSVNNVYYFYRNGTNWEFYAKTNGTITFTGASKIDIFMLGNGSSGGNGYYGISSQYYQSQGYTLYWCSSLSEGGGGTGGTRKTKSGVVASGAYAITIASTSSFGSYKSNDTGYSQSGASANGGYCFDDENAVGIDGHNYLVGAGGGRGAISWADGDGHGAGSGGTRGGGSGGEAYGGGGGSYANNGSAGSYWGAGGGGGGAWGNATPSTNSSDGAHAGKGNGAAGYKGFVAMRNAR